ncbi:hypothetical protein JKG68_31130, partial [Microvirga aerilata]|nr:hypothetical protein [Microvirga aerilata]
MEAGRLAEVAMNKPKEEIHKRIEKLRAALEVPPLGAFAPRAANPPPIAATRPQAAIREVAAIEAVMPGKVDASIAEAAQIAPEVVGADSLPQAEPRVISHLLPQMTMFMPSAFQATLYRIDVSLKRPLLSLPDGDQRHSLEPNAAAEPQDIRHAHVLGTERHAAVAVIAKGAPVQEIEKSIEAVEVNEFPAVAELMAAPEAAQVRVEEDLDLGYLALYGELVAPFVGLRKVEIQEAPGSIAPAPAIEVGAAEASDYVADLARTEATEEVLNCVEGVQDLALEHVEAAVEHPDVEHVEGIESQGVTDLESDGFCVAEAASESEIIVVEYTEVASLEPNALSSSASDESSLPSAPLVLERPRARAYELPDVEMLGQPPENDGPILTEDILEERAGRVEKVIRDFGVKGEVIHVHPGPVVTLYELEPAPGVKSSRVIALSEDIARSMSAVSARVAVIPGRNAIGIELPNDTRETVYLREMLEAADFKASTQKLPICLGKTIGGEPVIADLARMPHLLVAG